MRVSEQDTTVILADPPWPHANGSRTNSGKSPKYPLMLLREVEGVGPTVKGIAGDNAVLFMWATSPHLPGAIEVMKAWGFTYKSFRVWRKGRIACGFWTRSNAEIVLIGERGRPAAPVIGSVWPTVFRGDRAEARHSSKPSAMHVQVEESWPNARKVELFARVTREGWECIGADLGQSLTPEGVTPV